MSDMKTVPTADSVVDFLATLDDEQQRRDSEVLVGMMQNISSEPPVMWGTSIVGFGTYTYTYASGHKGDWPLIAFSPRKGKLSLYVTYDASSLADELKSLGKHKIGKGCIYINRLADVDNEVLTRLIKTAYKQSLSLKKT